MLGIICYSLINMMKIRILLVDDEPDLLEVLAETLESEGYETLCARNAAEFYSKAFSAKPHLIILDIDLGGENGPDIYNHLLRQGLDPQIPVIFLSGLIEVSDTHVPAGRHYTVHARPFNSDKLIRDINQLTKNLHREAA